MSEPSSIICKPTPWFTMRAAIIIVMFGVFAFMFYRDGSVGYREKNLVYFLYPVFEEANQKFVSMNSGSSLTPGQWKDFAEAQSVPLVEDPSIFPADTAFPMAWPEVLHDFDRMQGAKWHDLWLEYSAEKGLTDKRPEHPYDARKIREQWVVFWICLTFVVVALFFLIRTLARSVRADDEAIVSANGKRIRYEEMKRLDLRKWEAKGLAFVDYEREGTGDRVRIDGLTYGGFKTEDGEPAERLMKKIREKFRGEIIEYVSAPEGDQAGAGTSGDDRASG